MAKTKRILVSRQVELLYEARSEMKEDLLSDTVFLQGLDAILVQIYKKCAWDLDILYSCTTSVPSKILGQP